MNNYTKRSKPITQGLRKKIENYLERQTIKERILLKVIPRYCIKAYWNQSVACQA